MTKNLIESLQKNLGFQELQKVDPNTQEVAGDTSSETTRNPGQAVIPAVLMGLYRFGNTEKGAEEILRGNNQTSWLDVFFEDTKDEAISKVSSYSGITDAEASEKMEATAKEAIRLIRENTPSNSTYSNIKDYIAAQRKDILVYLPARLQIGTLLNDNTLDDRTNKMEGPLSNHMHFFEKLFSGSTTEKNEKDE